MLGLVASVVAMEKAGEVMDSLFGPSCIIDENGKIWGPEEILGEVDKVFKKSFPNFPETGKLQRSIINGYK